MGRPVRCVAVALLLFAWLTVGASAQVVFDAPEHAVRELVGKRTASSRSWEMPSGERVTQVAAEPVQWQDGKGDWHEYDLSLRASSEGWEAEAGRALIDLPAWLDQSANRAIQVASRSGDVLSMTLLGDRTAATVANGAAVYSGVAKGVDLRLRPIPEGLKEDVVLQGPDSSRDLSYRVSVGSGDLALERNDDGGLQVVRGKELVFVIPAPVLADAAGVPSAGRFEIREAGPGAWIVTTVLPEKWLDDSARKWPVMVDPTVTVWNPSLNDECNRVTVIDGRTRTQDHVSNYCYRFYNVIWVGKDYNPVSDFQYGEVMLNFNQSLTVVQNDRIHRATLQMYRSSQSTERPLPVDLKRITVPWSRSVLPPASYTDPSIYTSLQPGPNGPVSFDVSTLVDEWQHYRNNSATGFPNYGLQLSQRYVTPGTGTTLDCSTEPCPWTGFTPSWWSDATHPGPMLEVRSWPAAAAGNAVISPGEGDLTGRRVKLQARALASSVSTMRFQYIAGTQTNWTDIPLSALSTPTRGSVSSIDIPVSGPTGDRRSDLVVWDLSAMPGGDVDGPIHVRAWLDSSTAGDGGMTEEVNFRLERRGVDKSATEPIGPGDLNLLSGEFSMVEMDASARAFLQDLMLTRTYRSRGVSVRNADMFGSGWDASVNADGGDLPYKGIYDYSEVKDVAVDRQTLDPSSWNWELFFETFVFEDLQADIETVTDTERFAYEYAVVEAADGTKMTFTQVTDSGGNVTGWTPDDLHPGYSIRRDTTATSGIFKYTLTDPAGNVAVFLSEVANSPNARLSTFQQPGSTTNLAFTYEASGTRQRLKTVTAPAPASRPARSLTFNWSNVGSPAVPRVTSVDYRDGYGTVTTMATYSYDANARLIQMTDPRIASSARNTRYHYNAAGQLDQITPSGEAAWYLTYTRIAGDTGPRLATVSRAHPDGGTATRTISYNVPLAGAGAPYDMSTGATARWGQVDDLPWDAVAIWPEDTVPNLGSPDYAKATIHYLDLQGLEVNVAAPGGAISTVWHDANGNVIRELTPQGRAIALAAGANSATVAADRSTLYQYAGNGIDLLATREPVSQIKLSDGRVVTGRRLTTTNYDVGAPGGGPYHLPTSEWRAVEPTSGGQVDVRELMRYDYSANGGMSGWTARHATKTIKDPGGRALTSYSILHPTYPVVEETRTPGAPAGGTTPDVQWYQYYGITPSARVPSGLVAAGCNSYTGAFDPPGFLCLRSEATLPDASVPRRWYDYNALGQVMRIYHVRPLMWSGAGVRNEWSGYNAAGEKTGATFTGGTGTATPDRTFTYDPATGEQLTASTTNGTIRRVYDSNGRLSQYTDAAGTVTTYRYDLRGRAISKTVDGATTTYGYDDRDNLTRVDDPAVGSAITASYDLDDQLAAETMPSGLVMTQFYDETSRPSLLNWTQTIGCSSGCTWVRSEVLARDAEGRIVGQSTANTQETLAYDTVGRLVQDDAVKLSDNSCVRKTYAYDGGGSGDSNRTSTTTWTSSAGSACGTGTSSTRALTFDTADRINSTGWAWDYFGRATSVPAADSGGTGALTAAYFVNDRVRQLTLDSRTHTYTRDALDRTKTIDSSGASKPTLTSTYRYSDDNDKPEKITVSDGSTVHDIGGPSGQVVASNNNGTLTYQLRDLQGSIVRTAPASGTPTESTEYDPFGKVSTPTPNVINWTKGLPANGWLGSYQRQTDFGQTATGAGGPIEMGARVYLPQVGRFLQVDPIDRGSLNPYDYANQDPVNNLDLTGEGVSIGGIVQIVAGGLSIAVGVTAQVACTVATDGLGAIHCYTATGIPIASGGILFSNGLNELIGKRKRFRATFRVVRRLHKNQCSVGDYANVTARAAPKKK